MYDLHTHSTASDGALSPEQLVAQAADAGITTLALTDHDTTAGLARARVAAEQAGIRLISAVELSTTWNKRTIHVVGLAIDVSDAALVKGMRWLQSVRAQRAEAMSERLCKKGMPGALAVVQQMAGEGGMVTRTHFARFLVQAGYASTVSEVFEKYLVSGKPGYVSTEWADLGDAIAWIRSAGGVPVLAHPQRYRLTNSGLHRLVQEFLGLGGQALEVVSGNPSPRDVATLASLARKHGLLASQGSDYHGPDQTWLRMGRQLCLPATVDPVWRLWEE